MKATKTFLCVAAATALALVLALSAGCHPYVPTGLVFTSASGPMAVTANAEGSKEGRATARGVLGLVSWGDAGTAAACRAAGISRVRTVDVEELNIIGVYYSYTTVVTGE
ncbi:MAG TPA: TRL domain-containing protein [Planctomycetota bacterium]|nr:TRL domain-containing protein [Planctomycetota bacterium]